MELLVFVASEKTYPNCFKPKNLGLSANLSYLYPKRLDGGSPKCEMLR